MPLHKTNQSVPARTIPPDESDEKLLTKRIERTLTIDFLSGNRFQIRKGAFFSKEKTGFYKTNRPDRVRAGDGLLRVEPLNELERVSSLRAVIGEAISWKLRPRVREQGL